MAKLKLSAGQPFDQSALECRRAQTSRQVRRHRLRQGGSEGRPARSRPSRPGRFSSTTSTKATATASAASSWKSRAKIPTRSSPPCSTASPSSPASSSTCAEVRDSERRLKASQLYMVDPSKGYPPKITFVKAGKPDSDDKDDDTMVAEDPDQPSGTAATAARAPTRRLPIGPLPASAPSISSFNSTAWRTCGGPSALGIAAPSPAAWAARGVAAPPANPNFPQYAPATRAPMPAYGTPPAAWAARGVATPPANPNVPQYAPATRPATPAYGTPLPPPSADPNWQPAAGPVPQPMTQPMVIRGQYTGDRGFAVPNLNSTDSPATGTAPNDVPAAAGDNWSAPAPASPPSPRYPPPSAQYAPVTPYAAPQQQPAYSPAVSQSAPLSRRV